MINSKPVFCPECGMVMREYLGKRGWFQCMNAWCSNYDGAIRVRDDV